MSRMDRNHPVERFGRWLTYIMVAPFALFFGGLACMVLLALDGLPFKHVFKDDDAYVAYLIVPIIGMVWLMVHLIRKP